MSILTWLRPPRVRRALPRSGWAADPRHARRRRNRGHPLLRRQLGRPGPVARRIGAREPDFARPRDSSGWRDADPEGALPWAARARRGDEGARPARGPRLRWARLVARRVGEAREGQLRTRD